jgi:hypothetical protein
VQKRPLRMSSTTIEAATYVRTRLRSMESRITQEQMQVLISDLQVMMGRALTPIDVAEVVEVFREVAADRTAAVAA